MKIVFKSVQDENYNYYWTKSKFYTGADFLGGVQGGAQTFALWQSRFAFITQKNVHKDLLTLKYIDTMCF